MPVEIALPIRGEAHLELQASIVQIAPAENFGILIKPMDERAVAVVDDHIAGPHVRF